MPTFKPKNAKKIPISKKNTVTLDTKHTQIVDKFKKEEEQLPCLKKKKKKLELELEKEKNKIETDIDKILDIEDKIKDIKKNIKDIKIKKRIIF